MPESIPMPAAEALLTGIMTDTNNFRDNASNPETFEVLADLLRMGVDKDKVKASVYNSFTPSRMRLLGYALENMVVLPEYNAAYMAMSLAELNRYSFQPGDTESFVNYPLNVANVKLSAYMSEQQDGAIRFSFRSKGDFSVNDFAREHFNGGGHFNAAGGRLTCSLKEAITFFVAQLENYKDALQSST
jgi:phosphoesterase RecJ-like protein